MQIVEKTRFNKNEFKKRLYTFILKLINCLDQLPKDKISSNIVNQLIRSATSILANYIEGQSASSKKEFLIFIQYCLKSANETKIWIAILRDSNRITKEKAQYFLDELDAFSNIFASSVLTIKGKKSI